MSRRCKRRTRRHPDPTAVGIRRARLQSPCAATLGKACDEVIKAHLESKTRRATPPPSKETVRDWVTVWLRDYAPHQCAQKRSNATANSQAMC